MTLAQKIILGFAARIVCINVDETILDDSLRVFLLLRVLPTQEDAGNTTWLCPRLPFFLLLLFHRVTLSCSDDVVFARKRHSSSPRWVSTIVFVTGGHKAALHARWACQSVGAPYINISSHHVSSPYLSPPPSCTTQCTYWRDLYPYLASKWFWPDISDSLRCCQMPT